MRSSHDVSERLIANMNMNQNQHCNCRGEREKLRAINFAIFNVADCFVTVGATLLFIGLLIEFRREELQEKAKKECRDEDRTSA